MQQGLFDSDIILNKLSHLGDPLEKLYKVINWEIFREPLEKHFKSDSKGPGGRPPYDYVMMFKILILQKLYGVSDDKIEYQIIDRISFRRFLKLELYDKVPDAKTVWHFRNQLSHKRTIKKLFRLFNKSLESLGLEMSSGSIVDASFVDVPKQRNTRDENKEIKNGRTPKEWKDHPNKLSQKDLDAKWAKKHDETHYGYKNHTSVDVKTKLIKDYDVSSAEIHDSKLIQKLISKKDLELYADSAYYSEEIHNLLAKNGIEPKIIARPYRNNPLTATEIQLNKKLSKIRVRVEHVFGWIKNTANGDYIRSIGKRRSEGNIGLINMTYNMCRTVFLLS